MIVQLGQSVSGRSIDAHVFRGSAASTTLVLSAMHGDEPKTVTLTNRFIEMLQCDPARRGNRRWVVVPLVNPDGYARRRRKNDHDVDINRNFPTRNWSQSRPRSRMHGGKTPASEPETCAVVEAIRRYRPSQIITIHSIDRHRFCNNYDGPGRTLARRMSRLNGYPVVSSIGYPTPGSFGTFAGSERGIATVTLELPVAPFVETVLGGQLEGLVSLAISRLEMRFHHAWR